MIVKQLLTDKLASVYLWLPFHAASHYQVSCYILSNPRTISCTCGKPLDNDNSLRHMPCSERPWNAKSSQSYLWVGRLSGDQSNSWLL